MKCPFCGSIDSRVVDSRDTEAGDAIRRRRECLVCERRFTTYERIDEMPLLVAKRDGRNEVFDRDKLLRGLVRACVKRDIPLLRLEQLVDEIENRLRQGRGEPVPSAAIGEHALRLLRALDKVAYVRFASVYRQFDDVEEFQEELSRLEGDVPELEGQEKLVADPLEDGVWQAEDAVAVPNGRYTARRDGRRRAQDAPAPPSVERRTERDRHASRDLAVSGQHREGA